MGKSSRNRKKNALIRKLKSEAKIKVIELSIEDLLRNAQLNIEIFQYEKAQLFCQEVLRRDVDDLRALEVSASLCIELGNTTGAQHCLGRAITLAPDSGFTKYFSMGQLMDGKEALQCYIKGIELLNICMKDTQKENMKNTDTNNKIDMNGHSSDPSTSSIEVTDPLIRKLSNAYCSIAELYMSDLCDEKDAEKESESNVRKSIDIDSSNPEAYQQYANFLLIKENIEEAKENIKKSVSLWLPDYHQIEEGSAAAGSFDPIEVCPLTESARFSCTRILIELSEHKLAFEVLESLMADNDEDVYTWYLMGWNFYLEGDSLKPAAKHHLQRALEIHEKEPYEDTHIIDHIKELLEEMKDVPEPDDDSAEELNEDSDEMDLS